MKYEATKYQRHCMESARAFLIVPCGCGAAFFNDTLAPCLSCTCTAPRSSPHWISRSQRRHLQRLSCGSLGPRGCAAAGGWPRGAGTPRPGLALSNDFNGFGGASVPSCMQRSAAHALPCCTCSTLLYMHRPAVHALPCSTCSALQYMQCPAVHAVSCCTCITLQYMHSWHLHQII